ncbi:MAG: suppressor of fused domain protein [Deltaproteobacteria bacterium]|nr:suppressor of fused domain protein [Deltaproteobacteria bacterium]
MNDRVIALAKRMASESRSRGDHKLIRKLTGHVERHIGRVGQLFHDLVSAVVHIDILWVEPSPGRDFHTFVTCVMSEQPMQPSTQRCGCRYAELVLRLPRSWPLRPEDLRDPQNLWPVQELEFLLGQEQGSEALDVILVLLFMDELVGLGTFRRQLFHFEDPSIPGSADLKACTEVGTHDSTVLFCATSDVR